MVGREDSVFLALWFGSIVVVGELSLFGLGNQRYLRHAFLDYPVGVTPWTDTVLVGVLEALNETDDPFNIATDREVADDLVSEYSLSIYNVSSSEG